MIKREERTRLRLTQNQPTEWSSDRQGRVGVSRFEAKVSYPFSRQKEEAKGRKGRRKRKNISGAEAPTRLESNEEEYQREELELAAGGEDVEARREQRAQEQCAERVARVGSGQPHSAAKGWARWAVPYIVSQAQTGMFQKAVLYVEGEKGHKKQKGKLLLWLEVERGEEAGRRSTCGAAAARRRRRTRRRRGARRG